MEDAKNALAAPRYFWQNHHVHVWSRHGAGDKITKTPRNMPQARSAEGRVRRGLQGPRYTMAAVVELKDADFDAAVASGVTLVDFWAPWCGPCRMQGPIVEKLAEEMGDQAKICKMNVDEEQETAAKFMVQSIPTLLLLKNGEVVQQFVGVTRAVELKAALLDALA